MAYSPVKVMRYKQANGNHHHTVALPPPPPDIPEVIITTTRDVDENKERGNWSSGVEFLLSCLSTPSVSETYGGFRTSATATEEVRESQLLLALPRFGDDFDCGPLIWLIHSLSQELGT